MSKKPEIQLKPISKQEFAKIKKAPPRNLYVPFIKQFLEESNDVAELLVPKDYLKKAYQAVKRYSKDHDFPFVVRKREFRIFLLKTSCQEAKE